MMKYLIPCLLFLANDECFSALALVIMAGMFLVDCWMARPRYGEEADR